MSKLKKILLLILIIAVSSLGLTGCKKKAEQPSEGQPSQEAPSEEHPSSEHPK